LNDFGQFNAKFTAKSGEARGFQGTDLCVRRFVAAFAVDIAAPELRIPLALSASASPLLSAMSELGF
jgi:hypothetical protein